MNSPSAEGRIYDLAVFGDSCAAFGAALQGRRAGLSVLLISRHTGLLREASWSFISAATGGHSEAWTSFRDVLAGKNAFRDGLVDGACAEVTAAEYGQAVGIEFLYYASPWEWEDRDGMVARVAFMTKHGPEWIAAKRWVDASGRDELSGLVAPGGFGRKATTRQAAIFFRHDGATDGRQFEWANPVPGVSHATYGPSQWRNETVLRYTFGEGSPELELLSFARGNAVEDGAVVSHGSFVPFVFSGDTEPAAPAFPENLARVTATAADVGALVDAGSSSVASLLQRNPGTGHPGVRRGPAPTEPATCDVCVVGMGTGGALAALSAARESQSVAAVELLPCLGGVGTAGGIHLYYFGVGGGLQQEVDQRMAQVMPLFAKRKNVAGFHPMAKTLVLEAMLREAGVRVHRESMLGPVDCTGSRIESIRIASPAGVVPVKASAWVDATGDGDLACAAGARFVRSSRIDGVQSAFSQGSGRFGRRGGELFLRILNFDAGFVDATNTWDLSRARLRGLEHYRSARFTDEERPTYIAPLVGVRQTRQILTHCQVTLNDLVTRRRYPDSIGQTGCHFDSHAIDFEFESEEAAFWIWGCRNWRVRTAAEIPYRALIPRGIDNLLLGCRAVGATPDAHQSFRMQRDMQRVGEAAGLAAAFSARLDCSSTDVPAAWLQERLFPPGGPSPDLGFGYTVEGKAFEGSDTPLEELVSSTREGFGVHMYLALQAGRAAAPALRELLRVPDTSWRAAVVLAMLGDAAAEPRLLQAVSDREIGFAPDDPRHPKRCQRLAPNWLSALVFLRRCASQRALDVLAQLAADASLVHNGRTACALLCAAMADRLPRNPHNVATVRGILDLLLASPAPNSVGAPQRCVVGPREITDDSGLWYPEVIEDFVWQLSFAVAKARLAWGMDARDLIEAHGGDPRLPVREAFAALTSEARLPAPSSAALAEV